ncbi:hypothetical protein FH969_11140 [Miniimonas arenae]|uniref:Uncharacterized protein n=1 Tax=Miniimonas arenae TaxID=676201 RepID=A0A5C5B930_9MICO|nr:hypothetical protein [Miniimonas arenae]TNU73473.1 hypothetical protein FH969_11140 [Miniimonas arenae]
MPEYIVERVRRLQPFADRPVDGREPSREWSETSVVNLLSIYDNDDKHRSSLRCSVFRSENRSHPTVTYKLDEGGARIPFPAGFDEGDIPLEYSDFGRLNTAVYFTYYQELPILWAASNLRVKFQVLVGSERASRHEPVVPLVALLDEQVRFNIDAICYGFDVARDNADSRRKLLNLPDHVHWDLVCDGAVVAGADEERVAEARASLGAMLRQDF